MSHSRALAAHSWSQGTPVALGSGKKRRREDDNNDSDEVTFKAGSLISPVSHSTVPRKFSMRTVVSMFGNS